ncbi:MAG: hypothetical protein KME29_12255 [Calothrix sp. FI2-JRJ7]|jgi:hypothetical protein|nr:hypothetical protein [Calothrix sp. FI2-JRJ7]
MADIATEIKTQAELAIAIQGEILKGMQSGADNDLIALQKLKAINLTFDNFLKIKSTLDNYLGEIGADEYLNETTKDKSENIQIY